MDVYLIPLSGDRYELYCEHVAPLDVEAEGGPGGSWFARLRSRFTQMVRDAEEREDDKAAPPSDLGWLDRFQRWLMAWVAQRIAEQRLLWNLRREEAAVLVHPDDIDFEQAQTLVYGMLRVDYDRHRRWLVIDGVAMAITGPLLFFVPGPNLVAYYFAFRVVGHWLSMRGAAQGLHRTAWTGRSHTALTELRVVLGLDGRQRTAGLDAIAAALGLARLASFIERLAPR